METKSNLTERAANPVRRPSRLWLCFACGFCLVFVGMLLLFTRPAMHPSMLYAVRYPLWQYYGVWVSRLSGASYIGPESGGRLVLLETAVLHLLFSTAGGCVAAGVGWWLRRWPWRP